MDHEDSYNASDSPKISDPVDAQNEGIHEDQDFSLVNFSASNRYTQGAEAAGRGVCDSWYIDDLYCDGLSYADGDNQMIALDDKHSVLAWAAHKLSASPSARAMLSEAEDHGWAVALEPLEGPDFHLDVPAKTIVLDDQGLLVGALGRSEYFKNAVLVSFIRALRDVWQEKRHGAFDVLYGAEAVLTLERVRAADLDIMAVLVGWEIRGEGQGNFWRHLIGSEDGDIAMRFSGYLERDPSSLFNGKALSAAFTQWFRDPLRVKSCDHETLNYLDHVVQSCESHQAFGNKPLTPVGLEVLSCLPDKTAYLQGRGSEISSDPLYAGLSDPINQAHFMQILYDLKVTRVQDVPFRDSVLADMIFPNGEFTTETDDLDS